MSSCMITQISMIGYKYFLKFEGLRHVPRTSFQIPTKCLKRIYTSI